MKKSGMTLTEILVVLTILLIVMGALYSTFSVQRKVKTTETSLIEAQETGQVIINLLSRDVMMAGYGVYKKLAIYLKDGGYNGPDEIYLNDWIFLDESELLNGFWGQTKIVSGKNSSSIKVETFDIDADRKTEFKGGIYQFVISDTSDPDHKIAKINNTDNSTLTLSLDRSLYGSYVAPAIYYGIVENNGNYDLKKSATDTGGRQPLATDVVDLQVAYRDKEGNWYCDGNGTACPMNPFDPERIALLRMSLVVKSEKKTGGGNCPWPLENREEGPCDENYSYKVYTIEVSPRNIIYNR